MTTSTEHPVLLELAGAGKHYPAAAAPVLSGIDLTVRAGETLAIVGPSGCGKSTLLNLIGALDVPSEGRVLVAGQDLAKLDEAAAADFRNRQIGFVFQLHHLLPQCTVWENVLVPTLVNPAAVPGADERARRLLARVGLGDRLSARPGQLSGGERQRVALVRALMNRPQLLLADEPTGSLNRDGAEALTQLLLELNREEGLALIIVTHSPLVARHMSRILELRDGRLVPVTSA
jgi:ABC-type lipoprotein export system ATPase subunit